MAQLWTSASYRPPLQSGVELCWGTSCSSDSSVSNCYGRARCSAFNTGTLLRVVPLITVTVSHSVHRLYRAELTRASRALPELGQAVQPLLVLVFQLVDIKAGERVQRAAVGLQQRRPALWNVLLRRAHTCTTPSGHRVLCQRVNSHTALPAATPLPYVQRAPEPPAAFASSPLQSAEAVAIDGLLLRREMFPHSRLEKEEKSLSVRSE